jgi:hypothetical protein
MADRSDLLAIIRQVRRRWRLKVALGGLVRAAILAVVALLASSYALQALRFSPGAILTFRVILGVVAIGLVAWCVVRPLLRRVPDDKVALYLEEHEPGSNSSIVSAIALDDRSASPALTRRVIEQAIERCDAVERGRTLERPQLRRYSAVLTATLAVATLAFLVGPQFLRHGLSALLLVSRDVQAASPYRIQVTPGHATIARGADQTITATLDGFSSEQAELVLRKAADAPFERVPLVRSDEGGAFETMIFDVAAPIDYFVEANGVRSPVFRLNVVDLPYVQKLELEYHFPAYTGLAPQKVEVGGDIAVLRGTEVRLRATPTIASPQGQLVLDDARKVALAREADGSFTGRFVVEKEGFYRIDLARASGEFVAASPQHAIDALDDQPPVVSIAKPGRDTRATPVEEVYVEARADDDFGVRDLQLVYSVNGGPEKTVRLFSGSEKPQEEISAGHTFYLEELEVEPGDSVAYYAKVSDNDRVAGPKSVMSDMYFLQVRPFRKDFKPAPSQAGGGGGAGGDVGALSQQQRQIISGTFNVARDRRRYTAEKLRESSVVLTLSQARLREQVEGLVSRMNSRLVEPDPAFKTIAELLPQAATAMREAEGKLTARDPNAALAPEQRALQFLQKAEEEFELQVGTNRNGGGGGGAGSIAEDLADLFQLELDKLANQYETAERAQLENADQQIDELAERLKELARRQEQEAERQRRRAAAGQAAQGGGAGQRALAEQAEEAARRLEQLSREQQRPELMDAARRMREAADAMRRAAASGDRNAAAQAAAALDRLREAERRLERGRAARGERDVQDAIRRADEIAAEQEQIGADVQALPQAGGARGEQLGQLTERKNALESKVADLERQLDRTANEIRRDQREAARKVQEAANSIRDNKIKERIRYSKGIVQGGTPEQAQGFEEEIGANIDALREKLGEAARSLSRSDADAMGETLDKARQLARGLESLDERMRERAGQRGERQGNRGEEGQQGQSGQQGQESREGQQGQGQAGQQGQGGRGGENQSGARTDGRGGDGDTRGPFGPGGGYGDRRPWGFSGDDIRQFRNEVRQWSSEMQDLRRRLSEQGLPAGDLDEILRAFRQLDADRVYKDAAELERLQTFVVEGFKRFEYGLRRRASAANTEPVLSGSDEVPQNYRQLVEEYYRSLSRRRSPER